MFIGSGRPEVDTAHGTGAGNVEEPWVDAFGVEFMVARKDADVLAFCEVVGADGAGQAVIGVCNEVLRQVGCVGLGCSWCSGDAAVVGFHMLVRSSRCWGSGMLLCLGRSLWYGTRRCHFDISFMRCGRLARLACVVVSEFDDGDGLQHGTSDALCPALPCPPDDVPRSIPFGVPVRSDGPDNDDDQEKGGDDASDAVQDDHGHRGRWGFPQDTSAATAIVVGFDGGNASVQGSLQEVEKFGGGSAVLHRINGGVGKIVGSEDAASCIHTVENDAPGWRRMVVSGCEGLGRADVARVCAVVAANIRNVRSKESIDVGGGCQNQAALQGDFLALDQQGCARKMNEY